MTNALPLATEPPPTPPRARDEGTRRVAAALSLVVGVALLAVKYVAYLLTDSTAILADALESIVNVLAALFAIGGLMFAGRPADRNHPYGHGKIEYFSAVFEGGSIAVAALMIIWAAVEELVRGPALRQVELGVAITAGAGAANAGLGAYLLRTGRRTRSLILVADGQHVLSDFWTSAGVVVGLLLVRLTGWAAIDPLVAVVVGTNLGVTGVRLVRAAAGGLLDEEDRPMMQRLVDVMNATREPAIIDVHRVRAIRAGRLAHVDGHVIVPEYWTVEQAHECVQEFVGRVLELSDMEGDMVLHIDPCRRAFCSVCCVQACPVRRAPAQTPREITVDGATRAGAD